MHQGLAQVFCTRLAALAPLGDRVYRSEVLYDAGVVDRDIFGPMLGVQPNAFEG